MNTLRNDLKDIFFIFLFLLELGLFSLFMVIKGHRGAYLIESMCYFTFFYLKYGSNFGRYLKVFNENMVYYCIRNLVREQCLIFGEKSVFIFYKNVRSCNQSDSILINYVGKNYLTSTKLFLISGDPYFSIRFCTTCYIVFEGLPTKNWPSLSEYVINNCNFAM